MRNVQIRKTPIFSKVAGVSKSLPPVAYTKAIGENTSIDLFHLDQKVI